MSAKVLVIVLAETRADELTIESFCHNVLQPLKAELALCVRKTDTEDEYRSHAKYLWEFDESHGSWAEFYDRRAQGRNWQCLLELRDQWMGGPKHPTLQQPGSAGFLHFYRDLLREQIEKHALADEYDWFIITRSDFMWPIPHPPVELLSPDYVWFPDGERYNGLTDRHAVVPRQYIRQFLDIPRPIFEAPEELAREMKAVGRDNWNIESFIKFRLDRLGLLKRVRFFPYFMFLVRNPDGPTNWSVGDYSPAHRYFIKYATEFHSSMRVQLVVTKPYLWKCVIGARRFFSWRMYVLAFLRAYSDTEPVPARLRTLRRIKRFWTYMIQPTETGYIGRVR
jgi:hypothetical protein